jgi:hypothetical protein
MWGLRAVALARSGRQADALEALSTVRGVLSDELGLEPGVELRDLQTAILRQDAALTWSAPAAGAPAVPSAPPATAEVAPGVVAAPRPVPAEVAPLVGRDAELAALEDLLARAQRGTASSAFLVGEPGIGKSRLAAELGRRARERGFTVLLGRCSPDDGAPPFWPWVAALEGLGETLPQIEAAAGDEGARFRAWEEISRLVRGATHDRPILLVMDDLHWADGSSLGALRVLVDTMTDERLLVVGTRRTHPEPEGALADLAETAARRHALRLDLQGLDVEDAAVVAQQVVGSRPSDRVSADLRARTEGNPFYIVEYARLAGPRGDLRSLLDEPDPPRAVQDVLNRRIDRLPEDTVAALRVAAVIGRRFDSPTLARATGIDEEDLLDVVEPAQATGLLRDDGIDRYVFGHALVVDTLLSGIRPSRLARTHARVAEALPDVPGHQGELARHWLAAGPAHSARAWRAAVAAAAESSRLHDHERAARLLLAALDRLGQDDTATPRDEYDVQMALVEAHRWTSQWSDMVARVEQAIELARQLGDTRLLALAAIAPNQGSLWHSAPQGEVHEGVVAALRESLERLPREEEALRCRVLLSAAHELGHLASLDERTALVEEALVTAERIGDQRLLLQALMGNWMPAWSRRTTQHRLERITRAVALARELGDQHAELVSSCLRCVALHELGRRDELFDELPAARALADRLRIPFGLVVVGGLELSWRAAAGQVEETRAILEQLRAFAAQLSMEHAGDLEVSAALATLRWEGGDEELAELLGQAADEMPAFRPVLAAARWRAGDHSGAREVVAGQDLALDDDDAYGAFLWAGAAEAALYLGDAELGKRVAELMAPYAGEAVTVASMVVYGPVDLYLALASKAAGDQATATRHADRAAELCEAWQLVPVGAWLARLRAEHGF